MMHNNNMFKSLLSLVLISLLSGCFDYSVPTSDNVDLERYMGKWYQISANETSFNQGLVAVTADYTLQENGKVAVYNSARKNTFNGETDDIEGTASVVNAGDNSKLNVVFKGITNAPIPGGNYWIVVLDEVDYNYAAVADPIGVTLFILSRTPSMEEDLYQNILSELRSKGISTSNLLITAQPR